MVTKKFSARGSQVGKKRSIYLSAIIFYEFVRVFKIREEFHILSLVTYFYRLLLIQERIMMKTIKCSAYGNLQNIRRSIKKYQSLPPGKCEGEHLKNLIYSKSTFESEAHLTSKQLTNFLILLAYQTSLTQKCDQ